MMNYADSSVDPQLVSVVQGNAQIVTSGIDMKWGRLLSLTNTPIDIYDVTYTELDALLAQFPASAVKRFHTVFWSKESFFPATYDFSTVPNRLAQNQQWAQEVIGNYSGTFEYIDGWNEPIATQPSGAKPELKNPTVGAATTVAEIGQSLQYIRDEDSAAKIGINEFIYANRAVSDIKFEHLLALGSQVKSGGYPLDYIGLQFHIDCLNAPSYQDIYTKLRRIQDELGVEALITELDLRIANLGGPDATMKVRAQQDVCRRVTEAARDAGAHSVGWWGATDNSWFGYAAYGNAWPTEQALPFNTRYEPKKLWKLTTYEDR